MYNTIIFIWIVFFLPLANISLLIRDMEHSKDFPGNKKLYKNFKSPNLGIRKIWSRNQIKEFKQDFTFSKSFGSPSIFNWETKGLLKEIFFNPDENYV